MFWPLFLSRAMDLFQQFVQNFHPFLFLPFVESTTNLLNLFIHFLVVLTVGVAFYKFWLELLRTSIEDILSLQFLFLKRICSHFFIRLSKFKRSMRKSTVLSKQTWLVLLVVFANLSLVVVVGYLEHSVLGFQGQC